MTIEDDIIKTLRDSRSALDVIAAEVALAKAVNSDARTRIAALRTMVAALQERAVNAVDPAIIQPLIDDLARILAESAALIPWQPSKRPRLMRFAQSPQHTGRPSEGRSGEPRRRSSARAWA